jgi:hypothetical protein
MKRKGIFGPVFLTCSLGLALLGVIATHAALDRSRAATQTFMRLKLAHSQGLLEGLSLEKYDLIARNALQMRTMSQSNTFLVVRNPDYLRQVTNFQSRADEVYMAATDKNLDAATEAYVKMTRSCVECHRYFRLEQHSRENKPAK